jgi:hypothetical protein
MLRLLADENFNGRILRALKRRIPDLDVVRAQDTRLSGADDAALLEFAAGEKRVLLTHDQETLVGHAWQRVRSAMAMPGVVVAPTDRPIGPVIADLELLLLAGQPEDVDQQILFVPL